MPEIPSRPTRSLIAAIIPCYNEVRNIGEVLDVLHRVEEIGEIIVVDDGSHDGSADVISTRAECDARMRLIRHAVNQGKGQAIFTGWAATDAPFLLILDADLKKLTPEHVHTLLEPVLRHRADMTLGLFSGGHIGTDITHHLTPFLTGQRGMRSELLKYVSREAATGYGFEVALTLAARQQDYQKMVVPLKGVWHPPSEFRSERGFFGGIRWKLRMYRQIFRAWYVITGDKPLFRRRISNQD